MFLYLICFSFYIFTILRDFSIQVIYMHQRITLKGNQENMNTKVY